jgi:hypothetical protein
MAFRDVNPAAPAHVLLIPKHREGLTQLRFSTDDHKAVLGHLMWCAGFTFARFLFFSLVYKLRLSRPLASCELELELIQTQMAQKPILRAEVYARALRASHNVEKAEVWVGARCA